MATTSESMHPKGSKHAPHANHRDPAHQPHTGLQPVQVKQVSRSCAEKQTGAHCEAITEMSSGFGRGTPADVSVAHSAPRLASVASCRSRNALRIVAKPGDAAMLAAEASRAEGLRLTPPAAGPVLVPAALRAPSCVADNPSVAETPAHSQSG